MSMGFRGNKEHTELHADAFYFDSYVPPSDPKYGEIQGYIRMKGGVDKTARLSTNNSFTRDDTEFLPIPVGDFDGIVHFLCSTYLTLIYFNFADMNDRGASIYRYLQKISPGQQRFYCYEATTNMKVQFRQAGYPSACMSPGRPLGSNTISSYFKEFARKIGIKEWKSFGAHSLRAWYCTQIANSDVDIKSGMRSSRHASVSAFLGYVDPFEDEQRHKATQAIHSTPYGRAGIEKMKKVKSPTFVPAPTTFVQAPASAIYVQAPAAFVPTPATFVPAPATYVQAPAAFVPAPATFVQAPTTFVPAPAIFVPAPATYTIMNPSSSLSKLVPSEMKHHFEKANTTTGFTSEELFEIYDENLDVDTLVNNKPYNPFEDFSQHEI